MIRQSHDGPVLWAGNFLMAFILLGGCVEADEQSSLNAPAEEKLEQKKMVDEQGSSQGIGPVEENAVSGMDVDWKQSFCK